MIDGIILKGIGGFYYADTCKGLMECKARGKFRISSGKPMIGDRVKIEENDDGTGYMMKIEKRKNSLVRPTISNLDQLCIVISQAPPETDPFMIDKMIAIAENKKIEILILINKQDLDLGEYFYKIYQNAGFTVLGVSAITGEGIKELRKCLKDKVSAFAGNSGVGKSSLLNCLDSRFSMEIGEISDRIHRGRHTTRHVELLKLNNGGYIADTPGFSSFQMETKENPILKEDLQYTFREFEPFLGECRFTGCSHTKEKGCAVIQAVKDGIIAKQRHESYVKLYEEAKQLKEWEYRGES